MSPLRAIVYFLAACTLISCAARQPTLPAARAGSPWYDGQVIIEPQAGTLAASWRISFVPDSTMADSVVLLLNRGLRVTTLLGAGIARFTQSERDGWNRIVVHFTAVVPARTNAQFDLQYAGVPVFSEDGINRIQPDWIELGLDAAWHPVFASYDQHIRGGFRLLRPVGWDAVASGAFVSDADGTRLLNELPLIDLAFAAAPIMQRDSAQAGSVYHINAQPDVIGRVLQTATACAAHLNQQFGRRETLPHVKLVLAPRSGPGYARTNYIVITDVSKLPPEALSRFLCHELAHFWSIGAIASGPENWLNEAFAEYVAVRYIRDAHGTEPFQKIIDQFRTVSEKQPPVWTPASTTRPSGIVAYRKAPYLLHLLEERIGKPGMDQILVRRMSERITRTPQLLAIIADVAGQEHADWFATALGK